MEFERRLVIARHEAQIAAIFLGIGEFEIAVMQADQDRHALAGALAGGDGDLGAIGPIAVPPGLCLLRREDHGRQEGTQQPAEDGLPGKLICHG